MRRLFHLSALLILVALMAPSAATAGPGQTVGGVVTVTGTAGKDELRIRVTNPAATEFSVTPAATVTSTGGTGTCSPDNDPQTGRPVRTRCATASISSLVINLLGGDDDIEVDDDVGRIENATVNAGPGNDVAAVDLTVPRTFNGDIGDDTFEIPGLQSPAVTAFNGGGGSDRASYGDVSAGGGVAISITGSLQTNQVQLKRNESTGLVTHRTDTLNGIEEIEGTPLGDILTGGPSTLVTELVGGDGPDNLVAGDATTTISGGSGLDSITSGAAPDILEGGTGIDIFRAGRGDTLLMRDGYAETIACAGSNTVVNDLADAVTSSTGCTSIQTAAAKHRHDTTIAQRRLKIAPGGGTLVRLKCPLRKPEPCTGTLRLKAGRRTLASKTYLILQGRSKLLRFKLTRREAARAAAKKVDIFGEEVDDDGRPRAVLRRIPARRRPA